MTKRVSSGGAAGGKAEAQRRGAPRATGDQGEIRGAQGEIRGSSGGEAHLERLAARERQRRVEHLVLDVTERRAGRACAALVRGRRRVHRRVGLVPGRL